MSSQRVAIGLGLVAAGGVTIYGGVTGRLAPMLGAIFAPSTLSTKKGSSGPSWWKRVANTLLPVVLPVDPLGVGGVVEGLLP